MSIELSLHQELELADIKQKLTNAYKNGQGIEAIDLTVKIMQMQYMKQNALKNLVEKSLGIQVTIDD
jgi:hypothetical protein